MTRIVLASLCIGALLPPIWLHADPTPTVSLTLEELKAEFEKQDAELNQVYTETMARLPAEQQKELKKSEVEWIKHRDQEGTDPGLNWLILSFKTRERIKDIRADFAGKWALSAAGLQRSKRRRRRISQGRFFDQGFSRRRRRFSQAGGVDCFETRSYTTQTIAREDRRVLHGAFHFTNRAVDCWEEDGG